MKHTTSIKHNLMRAAMTLALMLACAMAWAQTTVTATYLNADGTIGSHEAIAINQSYMPTTLGEENTDTWYVVTESVNYDYIPLSIALWGNVTLILGDGCTMTVNTVDSYGIDGYQGGAPHGGNGNLTIYGQRLNTGTLYVGANFSAIGVLSYTQHSGNVTAESFSNYGILVSVSFVIDGGRLTACGYSGIVSSGNITIRGGQVDATGTGNSYLYAGIKSLGDISLDWTTPFDQIKANSYHVDEGHTISIPNGKAFLTDDATPVSVSGTISDLNLINGKTLTPNYLDDFSQTGTEEYTIHTAAGWNYFCDFIDNGEYFSNKTVKLGANIEVTRMASRFSGTFEGDHKTLTLHYGTADEPIDARLVAPFVTIMGSSRFRDLTIDGYIYSTCTDTAEHKHTGGLIGQLISQPTADIIIEQCVSNVEITATGGQNAGGFIGLSELNVEFIDCLSSTIIHSAGTNNGGFVGWSSNSYHDIIFKGCVFNGKMLQIGGNGDSNGGFIGRTGTDKYVSLKNCLVEPAALADGEIMADGNSATFALGWQEHCSETNCYYMTAFGTSQGKQARSITAGENVTVANAETPETEYSCSGLHAYPTGIKYNNVLYAGSGETVRLTLSNTPPTGYAFNSYTVSPDGATLTGSSNPYTLTMPDDNVVINATFGFTHEIEGYGEGSGGWVFIASPIVGSIAPTAVGNLIGEQTGGSNLYDFDLYRFDQSADLEWENYHQHLDDFNLINGQGYLYATKENRTLEFDGEFNTNETMTVDLVYDASADLSGWNLVGNPFTTNAYVNKPYYRMNVEGSDVVPVARYWVHDLPACTGVMVQADAENETATFSKTEPEPRAMGEGCLLITLTGTDADNNVEHDRVIVNFNEGIELGKFVFNGEHAKICIPKNDKDYAIAYAEKTGEIPLNFKAASEGQYTLSVIPEAAETTYLHLIDNLTSTDIDLLATPVYSFSATASDYTSRFRLVFRANAVSENGASTGSAAFAFISNGEIVITGLDGDACNASLQVVDILGHVCRDAMLASPYQRISTTGMPAGLYVLRLIDGETVRTQKIVID